MYAYACFVMCFFVGSSVAHFPQREAPYHIGPNDPFAIEVNPQSYQEPSQRLFWGNQGSNQVGGTGLWAHFTNKFPFLGSMFGRLEVPTQYGVPNQNSVPSTEYGVPGVNQVQYYPQQQQYYPQQFYQPPQVYRQQIPQQFGQGLVPSTRDVGITDDAIIVTPPFVPAIPQPAPSPVPVPAPAPSPAPYPDPVQGYAYSKPQFRLELPHK